MVKVTLRSAVVNPGPSWPQVARVLTRLARGVDDVRKGTAGGSRCSLRMVGRVRDHVARSLPELRRMLSVARVAGDPCRRDT